MSHRYPSLPSTVRRLLTAAVLVLAPLASGAHDALAAVYNITYGANFAAASVGNGTTNQQFTGAGSWHKGLPPAAPKFETYIDVASQLGATFKVNEIASLTFHTENNATNPSNIDFYTLIYTTPFVGGDGGTFYGRRLIGETIYANGYVAPTAGVWNTWTTAAGPNQLTFFDSNHCGNAGFNNAPTLADLSGTLDWSAWGANPTAGTSTGGAIDYGNQTVRFLSFQTGSAYAVFEGHLDAVTLTLTNGDIYNIDLEATPDDIYVDDNWIGFPVGAPVGPGQIIGVTAFATVQGGVNAALPGSTVHVAAGSYTENVTLNKDLTLSGAQAGVAACGRVTGAPDPATESIITGPAAGPTLLTLVSGSAGSTIDGFSFIGGTRGIESATGPIHGVSILNNHFAGFTGAAVFLNDAGTDVTVSRNNMEGSSKTATGGTMHLDTDLFDGFHLTDNCILNAPFGPGVFADGVENVRPSARKPLISGNRIENHSTNAGLNLGSRAFRDGTISGNRIANNAFDGLQGGMRLSRITGNLFDNNGRWGLALTSFGNTTVARGAFSDTITGNTFTANDSAGLFISASMFAGHAGSNYANFNDIVGNGAGGAGYGAIYRGTETFQVGCNWWGHIDGPDYPPANSNLPGDGLFATSATYFPWLDGSITGTPSCNQFPPVATTTVLSSDLNPSNCGQKVNLNATVAPATATGTVTFYDGGGSIGSAPVSGGVATLSVSTFTGGHHTLTATYGGDGDHLPSTSALYIQNVHCATTSTTVVPTPCDSLGWFRNNMRLGGSVDMTATYPQSGFGSLEFGTTSSISKADWVRPNGNADLLSTLSALTVDLYRNSSSTTAAHLTPAVRLFVDNGNATDRFSYLIWEPVYNGIAVYPTDTWTANDLFKGNFWQRAFKTTPPNVTIEIYSRTLADWLLPGTVTDGGGNVSNVVGPNARVLSYEIGVGSGWSDTFAGAADNFKIGFGTTDSLFNFEPQVVTSVTLAADPAKSFCGVGVKLIAVVSPSGVGGTVQFVDQAGPTILGSAPVVNDTASVFVLTLQVGIYSIVANFQPSICAVPDSSAKLIHEVNQGSSTLTLAVTPNPVKSGGDLVTIKATVNPSVGTGDVNFFDGPDFIGVSPVINGMATLQLKFAAEGDHTLRANYSGDSCVSSSTADTVLTVGSAPSISIADLSSTESNSGTKVFKFLVTLSSAINQAVTVNYQTSDGTATLANNDYVVTSGTVTIPAGALTDTARVSVRGDTNRESDETFNVTLSNPTKATIADGSAVGTILNDDAVPQILHTGVRLAEGHPGLTNILMTVSLSNPSDLPVSVNWATSDSNATLANNDYVQSSGSVTIPAKASSATFTVQAVGDSTNEDWEVFHVDLSSPVNATLTARPWLRVELTNDDTAPMVYIDDVQKFEGDAGTTAFVFRVRLSRATAIGTPTVSYTTQNGTATLANNDYQATSGSVTFGVKEREQFITVLVNGDTQFEADETFTVRLSNPRFGMGPIGDGLAVGTILNDDPKLCPTVTAIAPDKNDLVVTGGIAKLSWSAVPGDNPITTIDLYISRDNGATFQPLVVGEANDGTYLWSPVTGPGTNSGPVPVFNCWLRVVAHDAAGCAVSDSSGPFSIYDVVTDVLMAQFHAVAAGNGVEVRWELSAGLQVSGVDLERSRNTEGPWEVITAERRTEGATVVALDRSAAMGTTYYYRLALNLEDGGQVRVGPLEVEAGTAITAFALGKISPNPSRGMTRIDYELPREASVRVSVMDVAGREVAVLASGSKGAGRYQAVWSGETDRGRAPAGLYFIRYQAPGIKLVRRLVLAR